jgi:RHS repeat-associated protein
MKNLSLFLTAMTWSLAVNSQIVGGRDNGDMSPKSATGGKLSGGTLASDVNLLTGEYTSTVPLGAVTTPGGLNFGLSLDYSSNVSIGTTAPVCTGIPYGEGWSPSVPMISVETEAFHKYLLRQEAYQREDCGSTGITESDFIMNFDGPEVPGDAINKYTGLDEGDLYWFAPQLNIPGIATGRLVFKYLDASVSPNQMVFGLNAFESPVEVRMINTLVSGVASSTWKVQLSDGTIYWFELMQTSRQAPANTRVFTYDKCDNQAVSNNADVVTFNGGTYVINGVNKQETVVNAITPALSTAAWYCTKITHAAAVNQQIILEYEKLGSFDYFQEINKFEGTMAVFRDILLKKITSQVNAKDFEILEMDYKTLTSLFAVTGNNLINFNNPDCGVKDNLYSYKTIYKRGGNNTSFSGWNRYKHVRANDADLYLTDTYNGSALNPYLKLGTNYLRTGISGNSLIFNHGFIESDRISTAESMIPGDLYEVKTIITGSTGTVDIAVVTGDLGVMPTSSELTRFPTANVANADGYHVTAYEKTRGIELFSTFNMALKWVKPLSGAFTTSNFFVMPNVPKAYEGFNIQVGPGNSDVDYSTSPNKVFEVVTSGSFKGRNAYTFHGGDQIPTLLKSASPVPHNFGNGYPWGMMYPLCKPYVPDVLTNWWSTLQWIESGYLNNPTSLGETAKLEEISLVRYTKNPYMLQGVKFYRINGNPATTGKILVAQKQLEYTYRMVDLVENYDYDYDLQTYPARLDSQRKRMIVLLSRVRELPLDATLYATNYGLADTTRVLSTFFNYVEANTDALVQGFAAVKGEKLYLLSQVVNQLGGITEITYKPIANTSVYANYVPPVNFSAVSQPYSSYGNNKAFTISATVNTVKRTSELATPQTWSYQFITPMEVTAQYNTDDLNLTNGNAEHFRNNYVQAKKRGFRYVTINYPSVASNGADVWPSTLIEHYGGLATSTEFLCFGKIKSSKDYVNGILKAENINVYETTLAFEHGYIRPAFKRSLPAFNADMGSNYLYEDYYQNQSLYTSLNESLQELKTYDQSVMATDVSDRLPKMMEGYFYPDLLQANPGKTYLFNSYFVKLKQNVIRNYEDGLSKLEDMADPGHPEPDAIMAGSSCSNTTNTGRRFLETKTEYEYYEANHKGKAIGTAYHNLFSLTTPFTVNYATYGLGATTRTVDSIALKHEPSWQLASTKVTSPDLQGAYQKEEYFYYYDLVNRYDRHWYLHDISGGNRFSVQVVGNDTLAINNIVSNVARATSSSLPEYEGMKSARVNTTRTLAYQKTTHGKNTMDVKPVIKSEYYHFDNSWTYGTTAAYQPVLLRDCYIQIDTLAVRTATQPFIAGRIDRKNTYIMDFNAVTSATPDAFGKLYVYTPLIPYDNLKIKSITGRNSLVLPEIIENQMGVKTRFSMNTTVLANGTMTNMGLIVNMQFGYTRPDVMATAFEYTLQGLLKKTTEPSARIVENEYDQYLRLTKITENGTRILSEYAYNTWNHSAALSFANRTNQNSILTTIYNSATVNDKELNKSFIDPLGRNHSTIQAYYDVSSNLVKTHSPTIVYDNWNRQQKMYKSFAGTGNTLDLASNTTTAITEQQYDWWGHISKAADYGQAITTSTHNTLHEYKISNGVVVYCELGLTGEEAKMIMGTTMAVSSYDLMRHRTIDQDGKETIEYTNAFGQLAARMSYSDATTKVITLFGYDSYGNLNRVINPNKQLTTYLYNILGELIKETSVDAGTKRYMYNKLGLVSVVQDDLDRKRMVGSVLSPQYRVYKYDDYGRLLSVGKMNTYYGGILQDRGPLLYESLLVGSVGSPTFKYVFSNASSFDWLCNYSEITINGLSTIQVTPATFIVSTYEKTFAYGLDPLLNSIGKPIQENSYNNAGIKIHKSLYSYDAIGHIASQLTTFSAVNADGSTALTISKIDYPAYNYRGSLLEEKVDVNNDNTVDLHVFYEYDKLNRLTSIYGALGSVAVVTDATKLVSYAYDIDGKLTQKNHRIDDNTALNRVAMDFFYAYDVRDRWTQVQAKQGTTVVSGYNLFYDGLTPTVGAQTAVADQNWNGNINGVSMEYNFGTATNVVSTFTLPTLYGYKYDKLNRITQADGYVGDFAALVGGTTIGDENYAYDKIGNITSLQRILKGVTTPTLLEQWNYNYTTGTNRLSGVVGVGGTLDRNYTYDANGNLLTDSYKTITQTTYGRAAYAYTLKKGTDVIDVIDYLYDTKDQRVYKKTDAANNAQDLEEYYLQDVFGRTMAIRKLQNTAVSWEYYLSGSEREMSIQPVGTQIPGANVTNTAKRVNYAQTNNYVYDHLGNTRIVYVPNSWNATASVSNYAVDYAADYSPYGKILREYVSSSREKFLTTQHERDAETGLDYRGARYYDSDVARFLSLDPMANQYVSLNPYNYVMGNPVMFIDPTGRSLENTDDPRNTNWTENHLYLNNIFGDPSGFNQKIGENISARILSGGVNQGNWLKGKNGIDIYFGVSGAKGANSINILQTARFSNDDKVSVSDAHADNTWISSDGSELGILDSDNGGYYYTQAEYGSFVNFDASSGNGTIHFRDRPDQVNNPLENYDKVVFHTYVVAVFKDAPQQVLGRVEWTFFKNGNKMVQWSGNTGNFIPGGLTATDMRIVEISLGQ